MPYKVGNQDVESEWLQSKQSKHAGRSNVRVLELRMLMQAS